MTFTGREVERLIAKGVTALERAARAAEETAEISRKMLTLATEEPVTIEPGPPVCPFCGAFNPKVHSSGQAGSGPMAEIAMFLVCDNCDMSFIGIPDGWITVGTRDEALEVIQGRKGMIDNERNGIGNRDSARGDQGEQPSTSDEVGPGRA